MVKFVLLGHVDHGKSTCGGRLLLDTGNISEQEMNNVIKEAEQNGMKSWWLSYFLDDDKERTKGKTMAYSETRFTYHNREHMLVDVPGHRKYISEVIKGCSDVDTGLLIVSARKGELSSGIKGQTLEHLYLVRSMGCDTLIIGVNKMDSISWDMERYKEICKKMNKIIKSLAFKNITFVPISALTGENIVTSKDNHLSLISILENIPKRLLNDDIIYSGSNLRIKVLFLNINNVMSMGYKCVFHTESHEKQGEVINILKNGKKIPMIVSSKITNPYELEIKLDQDISGKYIVMRDGDNTVALGRILNC